MFLKKKKTFRNIEIKTNNIKAIFAYDLKTNNIKATFAYDLTCYYNGINDIESFE